MDSGDEGCCMVTIWHIELVDSDDGVCSIAIILPNILLFAEPGHGGHTHPAFLGGCQRIQSCQGTDRELVGGDDGASRRCCIAKRNVIWHECASPPPAPTRKQHNRDSNQTAAARDKHAPREARTPDLEVNGLTL